MTEAYRAHLLRRLVERGVPVHLHEGLIEYIAARRPVGSFLTAVLANNLHEAVVRESGEVSALRELVRFLHNDVTSRCWGSPEAVAAWLAEPGPAFEVFE